jgi:signal transduction histidine kinase
MKESFKPLLSRFLSFLDRHSILVAAVVILGYYLLTAVNLIEKGERGKGVIGYLLQFDSLIVLWIIAAVVIQLQKYRRQQKDEEERRKKIALDFEKQRIHLQLLEDITKLLQDNVNNPLATISITSHNIRKKVKADDEITAWLDRIDASLQRIHTTINDIKAYQTQKIVESTANPSDKTVAQP